MRLLALQGGRNVVAYIALVFALSMGTAWALQANSVKSIHIVNGQVHGVDLGPKIPHGMEVAGKLSAANSIDKTVTAKCPGDKLPIGSAGVEIFGPEGYADPGPVGFVALANSAPTWPPRTPYAGWRVTAIEVNGGTTEDWTVAVTVSCGLVDQ